MEFMIAANQPSVFKEKSIINKNILNFIIRIFFFELLYVCNRNIAFYNIETFRIGRGSKL